MSTSKPVHDANKLAAIIPFRPRRSGIWPHPSVHDAEPPPTGITNTAHLTAEQLSLFAEDLDK
jgi:hypothetical protein